MACAALSIAIRELQGIQSDTECGCGAESKRSLQALRGHLSKVTVLLDTAATYHGRLLAAMIASAGTAGTPDARPAGMACRVQLHA